MCPILLLFPAAAFSSHQESTEYSWKFRAGWGNPGWSPDVRGRWSQLAPARSALGNGSEHGAHLHKRYLETPARHLPTVSPWHRLQGWDCIPGPPCSSQLLSSMWLLSPPELLHGSCSKMEKMMLQWKKVWGWTVILCSVKELWPLQCQVHVSSWLSCVVRKSSCPMIYLVT